ncbi:aldehyde-activating protein [Jeongeupia sp. HS-3]|uniref:GFA family protein n=1 Tax=Jeongeupia sp. HS-3 TaxID=1009682 RepID=UPI0018A56A05|nr:GFA family protein [Jeongeupia sp. HS-3]BCL75930.1 aldehyde-activating protein [Jeongeupia sp. HS-3]
MIYRGSCHCGRIAFDVEGEIGTVIECNCSICRRRGHLLWFVPRASLKLVTPEADLSTYTFNKHVIQHHFCPTCGCGPFGRGSDPAGNEIAAVNVRCLEGIEPASLQIQQYDGRSK